MWRPDPDWQPLPGGTGSATGGLWRGHVRGLDVVVKRLLSPWEDDPDLTLPQGFAYWCREAEVARSETVARTVGLTAPETVSVDIDAEGITLIRCFVEEAGNNNLFLARALGRFATNPVPGQPWLAAGQLRARVRRTERRGGWPLLATTSAASIAQQVWQRRGEWLDALDALPQVLQHGDPTAANLLGRQHDEVVAIDWGGLGTGPAGHDLGLLALGAKEEFDPLLQAYVEGAGCSHSDAALGARVTAVLTAFSRAEWALARVRTDGPIESAFRHPSVSPYLKSLQRLGPEVEALLR